MFNVMYLAVVYCQLARYEYELKVHANIESSKVMTQQKKQKCY